MQTQTTAPIVSNLAALAKRFPDLAEKLKATASPHNAIIFLGQSGNANLKFNGMPLHNEDNPEGEALTLVQEQVDNPVRSYQDQYFLFGIGLGYLFQKLLQDTNANIVVYEPSLEVLRRTFESVDFSDILLSDRVSWVASPEEIADYLEPDILSWKQLKTFALPSYSTLFPEQYQEATAQIERILTRKAHFQKTCDHFHQIFYNKVSHPATGKAPRWQGTEVWKMPGDLWMYQELIFDIQPDLIIETGTALGGSAHYLATLCDLIGNGQVITIDISDYVGRPQHPRIQYVIDSSVSPEVIAMIKNKIAENNYQKILIILDANHSRDHVLEELNLYCNIVSVGSYIIVEDSNVNGHPVYPDFGPGPMEAIEDFLANRSDFMIDAYCERFLISQNPQGYLLRIQ